MGRRIAFQRAPGPFRTVVDAFRDPRALALRPSLQSAAVRDHGPAVTDLQQSERLNRLQRCSDGIAGYAQLFGEQALAEGDVSVRIGKLEETLAQAFGQGQSPLVFQRIKNSRQPIAEKADNLAQACLSLSLSFRPQRIILGGGLMLAPHLIGMTRAAYLQKMGGYLGESERDIALKIVRPRLGDDAGLLGGIKLALDLV